MTYITLPAGTNYMGVEQVTASRRTGSPIRGTPLEPFVLASIMAGRGGAPPGLWQSPPQLVVRNRERIPSDGFGRMCAAIPALIG